jgi:hypothetical protein
VLRTIGFAASRHGIGVNSINAYLIEQLMRASHFYQEALLEAFGTSTSEAGQSAGFALGA